MHHLEQTPLRNAPAVVAALIAHGTGSVRKEWDFGCITLKPHLLSVQKPLEDKSFAVLSGTWLSFCEHLKLFICVFSGLAVRQNFPPSLAPHKGNDGVCWQGWRRSEQQALARRWECRFPGWPLTPSKRLRNLQPQKLLTCTFPELCGNPPPQPRYVICLKGFTRCIMNNIKNFFMSNVDYIHFRIKLRALFIAVF